jgi:hypothetical protein
MTNMKVFKNNDNTTHIISFENDVKYYLIIRTYSDHMVATRKHNVYRNESWWNQYVKVFDFKTSANAYFMAIKRNNPTLKSATVSDFDRKLAEKYMSDEEDYNTKRADAIKRYKEIEAQFGNTDDLWKRDREERERREAEIDNMKF